MDNEKKGIFLEKTNSNQEKIFLWIYNGHKLMTMLTKYFDNNIELRNRKKKEKITIEDNVEKEMTDKYVVDIVTLRFNYKERRIKKKDEQINEKKHQGLKETEAETGTMFTSINYDECALRMD
ncbi:hypothetical protein DERP_006411 [Dermatophagoides pteronyssinus]|uniref:Uncharacterized protein n=1 Tax=Dermatophagoides pteronyssinus TaxID=6956 RepID=A0ABQ8IYN1_DERPT|nr:hypothetical protein DERP_006411 [Dermatophagoides pteronyssinus]